MQIICGGRQTGRTTKLIEITARLEAEGELAYIVTHSHREAYNIRKRAEGMGLAIPFPITYGELPLRGASPRIKLFVDNAELLIQRILEPYEVGGLVILNDEYPRED